jgi:hopanoid-associated phosphorylase
MFFAKMPLDRKGHLDLRPQAHLPFPQAQTRGAATRSEPGDVGGFMTVHFRSGEASLAGEWVSDANDGNHADEVAGLAMQHPRTVIALVGMAFEARIAAGPGVLVFCRHAERELAMAAESAARSGYRGIISFGFAGGLQPGLRAGDWIVASAVIDSQTVRETDATWSARLLEAIGGASHAPIAGVNSPVAEPAGKRHLHKTTGAAAVDMESHVVARLAAAHKLAFAAVRVIVDPAHRVVPSAALGGITADGRTSIGAVLRGLAARPAQLPLLARIGADAFTARGEMLRVRRLLGSHFGLGDHGRPASAGGEARYATPIMPSPLGVSA